MRGFLQYHRPKRHRPKRLPTRSLSAIHAAAHMRMIARLTKNRAVVSTQVKLSLSVSSRISSAVVLASSATSRRQPRPCLAFTVPLPSYLYTRVCVVEILR